MSRELPPEVQKRQKVERRIVRRLIFDALKAGFSFNVNNGGDTNELPAPTNKAKDVLATMFATDSEHLLLYKDGKSFGWVFLVYGNDGWDVVSDYSINLEPVMAGATQLADKYG